MLPNGVCAQSMLGRLQSVHLVLHGSFDASLQEMLSNCGPLERLDLELVDAASIELEDFFLNQLKAIRISGASVSTLAVGDHSFGQLQYWALAGPSPAPVPPHRRGLLPPCSVHHHRRFLAPASRAPRLRCSLHEGRLLPPAAG